MISILINWMMTICLLTILLAFGYWFLLKIVKSGSIDRYRFLKLGFFLLVAISFFPVGDFLAPTSEDLKPVSLGTEVSTPPAIIAADPEFSIGDDVILLVVGAYLVIALFGLVRYLISLYSIVKLRTTSNYHSRFHGIPILVHNKQVPPAAFGIIHPVILMNDQLMQNLTETERQLIFTHEMIHIRRKDFLINQVGILVKILLSFSPATHWLFLRLQEEMELSCDEEVRLVGPGNKKIYGETLISLAASVVPSRKMTYSGLFVSEKFITKRILAMSKPVFQRQGLVVLSTLLTFSGASVVTMKNLQAYEMSFITLESEEETFSFQYALTVIFPAGNKSYMDGRISLVPGVESIIEGAPIKLGLTARDHENGIYVIVRPLSKDGSREEIQHSVTFPIGEVVTVSSGAENKGKFSEGFILQLKHFDNPQNSSTLVDVPFTDPTPIIETVRHISKLTKVNIILPGGLDKEILIQIHTNNKQMELDQVLPSYRMALNAKGLDLVYDGIRVLKIIRLDEL